VAIEVALADCFPWPTQVKRTAEPQDISVGLFGCWGTQKGRRGNGEGIKRLCRLQAI